MSPGQPPLIMGILNTTPDSFSDGGLYDRSEPAIEHAMEMIYQGADIIDVGGESSRPGAARVAADEQLSRVLAVVKAVKEMTVEEARISIDTTLSKVAEQALDAGASIVNDISAGSDDPQIMELCAERGAALVLVHMQGIPETMQINPVYDDVVEEVRAYLLERAGRAVAAGIKEENIIIDPGIGFGKTQAHNMQLMAAMNRFVDTGLQVLLGTSRKRFMGTICGSASPAELVGATCSTTTIGVYAGVHMFRVHDVRENRQAADIAWGVLNQR